MEKESEKHQSMPDETEKDEGMITDAEKQENKVKRWTEYFLRDCVRDKYLGYLVAAYHRDLPGLIKEIEQTVKTKEEEINFSAEKISPDFIASSGGVSDGETHKDGSYDTLYGVSHVRIDGHHLVELSSGIKKGRSIAYNRIAGDFSYFLIDTKFYTKGKEDKRTLTMFEAPDPEVLEAKLKEEVETEWKEALKGVDSQKIQKIIDGYNEKFKISPERTFFAAEKLDPDFSPRLDRFRDQGRNLETLSEQTVYGVNTNDGLIEKLSIRRASGSYGDFNFYEDPGQTLSDYIHRNFGAKNPYKFFIVAKEESGGLGGSPYHQDDYTGTIYKSPDFELPQGKS